MYRIFYISFLYILLVYHLGSEAFDLVDSLLAKSCNNTNVGQNTHEGFCNITINRITSRVFGRCDKAIEDLSGNLNQEESAEFKIWATNSICPSEFISDPKLTVFHKFMYDKCMVRSKECIGRAKIWKDSCGSGVAHMCETIPNDKIKIMCKEKFPKNVCGLFS